MNNHGKLKHAPFFHLFVCLSLSCPVSAYATHSNWGFMNWTVDSWYIDVDSDQMDDNWETAQFGDLLRDGTLDFDGDGLIDSIEYTLGLSANNEDTDGDGIMDGTEVAQGSDPLDPKSIPRTRFLPWLPLLLD